MNSLTISATLLGYYSKENRPALSTTLISKFPIDFLYPNKLLLLSVHNDKL